ncbi:MAG: hypothetical protein HN952_01900 [Candidatus Cloacimonetes bacterium]|mgnify:CR=1 FL=1|jgi:hypothetical protein|nr:hypothetical protein [Candidatus Cloacimonadota bacterium]MBT6993685.1 hypothetical protein [Candidatus Cloacimonadota bacterium]MBT7469644.1 hypothetical protein [Candidatus Cloacimonadota bacterium]
MLNYDKKEITFCSDNLELIIADDKLSAHMIIKNSENVLDENEILKLIADAGIKYGFENATNFNHKNSSKKSFDKPFLIAKSNLPEIKINLLHLFDTDNCISENFQFSEIENLENARKNQNLAKVKITKINETDVFGNQIGFSQILEKHLGKNVYFSESDEMIKANENGYPFIDENNKICLKHNFIIKKNVADLHLKLLGDFQFENKIKNSYFFVDGNVKLDSIVNSRLVAKGDIFIDKKTVKSVLQADNQIIGSDDSFADGGILQSGKSISISTIGKSKKSFTEVEICVAPALKEELKNIINSEKNEELQNQLSNLLNESTDSKNKIIIKNKIYKNSFFRINKYAKMVDKNTADPVFSIENNALKIN